MKLIYTRKLYRENGWYYGDATYFLGINVASLYQYWRVGYGITFQRYILLFRRLQIGLRPFYVKWKGHMLLTIPNHSRQRLDS